MGALGVAWVLGMAVPPSNGGISDVPVYFAAAEGLRGGDVPYRDFDLEYPPFALLLFAVPGWVAAGDFERYGDVLAILLLIFGWLGQVAAWRLAPVDARAIVAWGTAASPLVFGTLVRERFDIAPAALMLIALLAFVRGRTTIGFVLLTLGGLLKLFPLVLMGVVLAWLLGRGRTAEAVKGTAVTTAVVGAVCLPVLIVAPDGFVDSFAFHVKRPVQIESTPAVLLQIVGEPEVSGVPGNQDRFKSQGLEGSGAREMAAAAALLQVLVLAGIVLGTWLAARRLRMAAQESGSAPTSRAVDEPTRRASVGVGVGVGDGRRVPDAGCVSDARHVSIDEARFLLVAASASVLAFVALGKVLSPQFLLWLWPLFLLLWGFGERAVAVWLAGATYLTITYFPEHYFDYVFGGRSELVVVACRDAALLVALSLLSWRLAGWARSNAPAWAGRRSR